MQTPEEVLPPDADVLEELVGQRMEVDDAQAASQEAQAQARQGHAEVSRAWTWVFDMLTELTQRIASLTTGMCVLMQTTSGSFGECNASRWRSRDELLDPLHKESREKECDLATIWSV